MTTAKTIAKNSIYLFLGDAFGYILLFILSIFLVRHLGVVNFGKYSFAIAFTSLFFILSDIGLSLLIIREIARDVSNAGLYLTNVSIIKLILSLITMVLIAISTNLFDYSHDMKFAIYTVGGIAVITSFTTSLRSFFRAFERMEYETLSKIIEKILVFGGVLSVLYLNFGFIEVLCAMLIAQLISLILTLIIIFKFLINIKYIFDLVVCKDLIRKALPFTLSSIFTFIYFHTDTIMLSIMKGDAAVGWYNAAYRLIVALPFFSAAFVGAIYPILSKYSDSSKDRLVIVYEKSFKFLLLVSVPLGIGTSLIAERLILSLYGAEYLNSVIVLQILIWVTSISFIYSIVGFVLASINQQRIDAYITGISAIMNIVLNFILIPAYSYTGAGIASLISQLFVFLFEFNYLQKNGYKIYPKPIFLKSSIAGILMGVFIYAFNSFKINLFLIIILAVLIYAIILLMLRAYDKKDIDIIKDIFNINKIEEKI